MEYIFTSGAQPPVVRSAAGHVLLTQPGRPVPPSVPVEDAWVPGPGGLVHALVSRPEGTGPFRTVFLLHGGPAGQDIDAFDPVTAAWVDHGFAVVRVNYRGSSGYGTAWRDAVEKVGLTELEDVAAVRAWAVGTGLADPGALGATLTAVTASADSLSL